MKRSRAILAGTGVIAIGVLALVLSKGVDIETPTPVDPAAGSSTTTTDSDHRAPAEVTLAPSPVNRPPAGVQSSPTNKLTTSNMDDARRVTITERVLSAEGNPLAGATVEIRIGDAVAARATSDASGAVVVELETPERPYAMALVVTRATGGLVAMRTASWWSGMPGSRMTRLPKVDLGDVRLAPGVSVELWVKDSSGVDAVAEVVVTQNWSVTEPIASGRSSAEGRWTIEALAPGPYYAYARGTSGRGTAWFTSPRKAKGPVELVLGELHDVDVTVVEKTTRAPVAAARISVTELASSPDGHRPLEYLPGLVIALTDVQGHTKIAGVAKGASISVTASAPGFPSTTLGLMGRRFGTSVAAGATSVEIVLERGRTVSRSVTSGEVPPPPEATTLTLESQSGSGTSPPSGTGRMSGGRIVIDDVPREPTHWLAVAPEGANLGARERTVSRESQCRHGWPEPVRPRGRRRRHVGRQLENRMEVGTVVRRRIADPFVVTCQVSFKQQRCKVAGVA